MTASPELPKHELLLKLLKMTASDNDAEALTAMRKANALLASADWTWDKLLAGKITVVGDPFGNLQRPIPRTPDVYEATPRAPPQPFSRPEWARAAQSPNAQFNAAQAQAPGAAAAKARASRKTTRITINYADLFGST